MNSNLPHPFPTKASVVCPKCKGPLTIWGSLQTHRPHFLFCDNCPHTINLQPPPTPPPQLAEIQPNLPETQ